jgi:TatD DNase family protein
MTLSAADSPLAFFITKGKAKRRVPVELPDLDGEPLIDTHAHLDMLDDPALALARAAVAGLTHVMTIADVSEDAARTYNELGDWQASAQGILDAHAPAHTTPLTVPQVGIIVGVHPHNARHFNDDAEAAIRAYARDHRTVGLGELGLDYHYDHSPRDTQRAIFTRQLRLAHDLNLPITLHLREAHDHGLQILQETGLPPRGAILHCFNLDPETARPVLKLGCVVSFAGPVTFKKADEVRAAAAAVPADRLIVETDCPFMAPEPFRGQKNEPALTLFTAATIATTRATPRPHIAHSTTATARRIFNLA